MCIGSLQPLVIALWVGGIVVKVTPTTHIISMDEWGVSKPESHTNNKQQPPKYRIQNIEYRISIVKMLHHVLLFILLEDTA